MSIQVTRSVLIGAVLLAATGCASRDEWATWKQHGTHFASGEHLAFSIRNTEGGAPRVTRRDLVAARDEAWWGKAVTVSQEHILER